MTKPFAWNVRYFPDVRLFSAYLDSIPRPTWCSGLTLHHTLIPTASQWRGRTSMDALGRYYRDEAPNPDGTKGWPSGPQLFVGPDGIWQGTPVNQRGTHAGVCNANRIGIEVVGDYDRREWPPSIAAFVYGATVALLRWIGRDERAINGHRDCASTKTCPGSAIDLDVVRREVATRLAPPPGPDDRPVIGVAPSITAGQFLGALTRHKAPLSEDEMGRLYRLCSWLDVDPAFFVALWKAEGGSPLGGSPLQQQTRQPINIKAAIDEWRPVVPYNGARWLWFETFQLGAFAAIIHLKNVHGSAQRLTVRQIITAHAPRSDNNNPERIVASILEDMQYMQAQP